MIDSTYIKANIFDTILKRFGSLSVKYMHNCSCFKTLKGQDDNINNECTNEQRNYNYRN